MAIAWPRPRLAFAVIIGLAASIGGAHAQVFSYLERQAHYPEGPVIIAGQLHYAEMSRDRVVRHDGKRGRTLFQQPGCGPTAIAAQGKDGLVILCHKSHGLVLTNRAGKIRRQLNIDQAGNILRRPNDAAADDRGGVYISSSGEFDPAMQPSGKLFYLDPGGNLRQVASHLRYPNGVYVAGRQLYVSEHLGRRILRYDLNPDGSLGRQQVFADFARIAALAKASGPLVGPDGIEVDQRGDVWVCEYGAGRILHFSASGELLNIIDVPLKFVTSLTFSPDGKRLFVTGARDNRRFPYLGAVLSLSLKALRN